MNKDLGTSKSSIASSTLFEKLEQMLVNDLETLQDLSVGDYDADTSQLLNSLMTVKQLLLDKLPDRNPRNGTGVSSPQREEYHSYVSSNNTVTSTVDMLGMFYEIESDQMKFVRQNLRPNRGLTSENMKRLEEIVAIYGRVTDQLDRMRKTQQISAVVLS